MRLAIGAAFLLGGAGLLATGALGAHALPLAVVLSAALLDPSQDVAFWCLRARERLDLEAALLLLSQLVWLALIAAGVALRAGMPWLLAATTAAYAARTLAGVLVARRVLFRPRFAPEPRRLIALVRAGLPFGLAMLAATIYARVGVLQLRALSSPERVAEFQPIAETLQLGKRHPHAVFRLAPVDRHEPDEPAAVDAVVVVVVEDHVGFRVAHVSSPCRGCRLGSGQEIPAAIEETSPGINTRTRESVVTSGVVRGA